MVNQLDDNLGTFDYVTLEEIHLAFSLIPVMTAWWGALGAFVLLLLFMIGISLNLLRGENQTATASAGFLQHPLAVPHLLE